MGSVRKRGIRKVVKKVFAAIVAAMFCCLFSTSCGEKYTFEEVKREFSRYTADLGIAMVLDNESVYFYDRTICFRDLLPKDSYTGFQFFNGNFYLLACVETDVFGPYDLNIYRCDTNGVCSESLLEIPEIKRPVKYTRAGNTLYLQYQKDGLTGKTIDSYDLMTGKYENIARGQEVDLAGYGENIPQKYTVRLNRKHSEFLITENSTGETFSGDKNFIDQTPYCESLDKYPCYLDSVKESRGKLYFIYRLEIESFFDVSAEYTFAVFEFDFKSKNLEYKSLVRMPDVETYEILQTE